MHHPTAQSASAPAAPSAAHAQHGPHVMSIPMLVGVATALLVLTGVTVALADYHFGAADIWVAMGIATFKASLVALFFMHLRYDKPFNQLVFFFPLGFVALFIGMALMDSHQYEPEIDEARQAQQAPAAP